MELQKLPKTKADIEPFVNNLIGTIISGEIDPLKAEIELKLIADAIATVRKDVRVKQYVMDEAEKYNGQDFNGANIKLTIRNTPDYSNDNEWATLKAKMKAREAFLKSTNGVDPDTGEQVVIYKSTEVLTIKFK